jgi:hypothetical protein
MARQDKTSRYPFAESVLDGARTQPYVHDCQLHVHQGRHVHSFRVFFKRHSLLPRNISVNVPGYATFRGDMVAMKMGKRYDYVNMSGRDVSVADWAISRFVITSIPGKKFFIIRV